MKYTDTDYSSKLNTKIAALLAVVERRIGSLNNMRILDFGCQHGTAVDHLLSKGLDVSGFDIGNEHDSNEVYRYSSLATYRIPWPDNTFNVVYSHHVFEHVLDYELALKELHRVLKKDGLIITVFPSKYRLLEAHFRTPLGGVLNSEIWCSFWSFLRKKGRAGLSIREYGLVASKTIREEFVYLNWKEIEEKFSKDFSVELAFSELMKEINGRSLPIFMEKLISNLHVWVLICRPK